MKILTPNAWIKLFPVALAMNVLTWFRPSCLTRSSWLMPWFTLFPQLRYSQQQQTASSHLCTKMSMWIFTFCILSRGKSDMFLCPTHGHGGFNHAFLPWPRCQRLPHTALSYVVSLQCYIRLIEILSCPWMMIAVAVIIIHPPPRPPDLHPIS